MAWSARQHLLFRSMAISMHTPLHHRGCSAIYTHTSLDCLRGISSHKLTFFFLFLFFYSFSNLIISLCVKGCRCARSLSEGFRLFLRLELRQSKRGGGDAPAQSNKGEARMCLFVFLRQMKWNCDAKDKLGTYVCPDGVSIKRDWIGLSVMSKHTSPQHRTIAILNWAVAACFGVSCEIRE